MANVFANSYTTFDRRVIRIFSLIFLFFLIIIISTTIKAQEINIDLTLDQNLSEAQSLSLPSIGINMRGKGSRLMNLIIQNETQQKQGNLYFHVEISSARLGLISIIEQEGQPFSLAPAQYINADNNQLQNGIPGVNERLSFNVEMTDAGKEFLNRLEGSTRLPNDIYTITVQLFQTKYGVRQVIDEASGEIGHAIGGGELSLSLLNPGGPVGSDFTISSTQPIFRWDGQHGEKYRIIIVKDDGQSPETLIQSASSTEPTQGSDQSGSLLDFEMADAIVNQPSFNYPFSGVQPLQAGENYFWQIFTMITTNSGTEERPSEIWEFSISEQGSITNLPKNENVINFLQSALGEDTFQQMEEDGFTLGSIEIDEQQYAGTELIMKLEELMGMEESGDITLIEK